MEKIDFKKIAKQTIFGVAHFALKLSIVCFKILLFLMFVALSYFAIIYLANGQDTILAVKYTMLAMLILKNITLLLIPFAILCLIALWIEYKAESQKMEVQDEQNKN